ncbi:MAG: endonuclease NucS [Chloroflexota bacterium]|nr:endonuclease NucS [Chloroflexota bacterium]
MAKPYVWQMLREAVTDLGGKASNAQIRDYILRKYGSVNMNTIAAQIVVCTVNSPSRVYYPENQKARVANTQYDFLYKIDRGQVVLYDPAQHGVWEIRRDGDGKFVVGQQGTPIEPDQLGIQSEIAEQSNAAQNLLFAFESHLRDFIVRNLGTIPVHGRRLQLYVDEQGRTGVEYQTAVGPIDILAVDEQDNLVVFELKLSRGADVALGQILRYMGWIKQHLAQDRAVTGVIVAKSIDEKLRYAASVTPGITLLEYDVQFTLQPVRSLKAENEE